jgi:hypothetical protein
MKMIIFSPRSDPLQLQQGLLKKTKKKISNIGNNSQHQLTLNVGCNIFTKVLLQVAT